MSCRRKVSVNSTITRLLSSAWVSKKPQVARSGYYSWLQKQGVSFKRAKQDEEISADIEVVFKIHRSRHGSPRIHQEVRGNGRHIARKRIERLMKRQGLQALQRRRFRCCPKQEEGNKIALNILYFIFNPTEPNRYWCGALLTSAPQKARAILPYECIYIQGVLKAGKHEAIWTQN